MTDERKSYRALTITVSETALAEYCDLETTAKLSGIAPELIRELCYSGHLRPRVSEVRTDEFFFDDEALYLLRKVNRLVTGEGINLQGVRIILELMLYIERVERELKFLRDRVI